MVKLQVKNGAIGGFFEKVDFSGYGHLVDGILFWNNSRCAVWFEQSKACVVQNCQFSGGFVGVEFTNGTGNLAAHNVATGLQYGFASLGTDYFDSNYADNCSFGIYATSATTKLRFNTTTNCTTNVLGGTSEFADDN